MSHAKRLLKGFVWVVSFCTTVVTCAAQEKDVMQSSSPAEAAAGPNSDNTQLEVAPGIPLPTKGMVWILDHAENQPRLARIYLNDIHFNNHRAENVVRAQLVVLKMGSTVELLGTAAKVRVNSHTPVIFVHKTEEEEEESQSGAYAKGVQAHYVLLCLRVAGDHRVISTFSAWQFGLKPSRHEDVVAVLTEEIAAGQWLKIAPRQALPDGEFTLVRMPDDKKLFESHTYDFGIGTAVKQPTTH